MPRRFCENSQKRRKFAEFLSKMWEFLFAISSLRGVENAEAIHNARSAFLGAKNADCKIKAQNEAKRFDPKEKSAKAD